MDITCFCRTLDSLKVDQEVYVYEDGAAHPCMKFKRCEEYETEFILVYDTDSSEFGIIQKASCKTMYEQVCEYYQDLCDRLDGFHLSVVS